MAEKEASNNYQNKLNDVIANLAQFYGNLVLKKKIAKEIETRKQIRQHTQEDKTEA